MVSYFVYILLGLKDKRLYVGCTSNLENRLARHNSGGVPATRLRRPLVLLRSEEFKDKSEAYSRERFLKSLWSARFKNKLKQEYLNKVGHQQIYIRAKP